MQNLSNILLISQAVLFGAFLFNVIRLVVNVVTNK